MNSTSSDESSAVAAPAVRQALAQALARGLADSSDRQRRLLSYLTEEEVEGRGDRLKAYSIATEVLGRAADFDAQQDSIVRVEIGRLRKSLELYYATAGRDDPVRIVIDKGQYRPRFEQLSGSAPASPPAGAREAETPGKRTPGKGSSAPRLGRWGLVAAAVALIAIGLAFAVSRMNDTPASPKRAGPRVAIAPFAFTADRPGQDYIAAGLRAELIGLLSEFEWLTVFPVGRAIDLAGGAKPENWNIDFLVKANVQLAGERVIVAPSLLDGQTGAVRWTARYETDFKGADVVAMQRQIATRIAADVGQPYGAVANLELTRAALDAFDGDDSYRCHLSVLQFWNTYRRTEFDRAFDCARRLGAADQAAPNLRALYALMLLDGARFGFDPRPRSDIFAQASDIAADAFRRDDRAALTRMARYSTALCQGDLETFKRVSASTIRDYPNNPAALLDVGSKLAMGAGDWQDGLDLVGRARELSSNVPAWFDISGVVDSIRRKESSAAGALHSAALETRHPLLLLVDVAAQKRGGSSAAAREAAGELAASGFAGTGALERLLDSQCWTPEAKALLRSEIAIADGQ